MFRRNSDLRQLLVQRLESLQQAGVLDLPRGGRPQGPLERGRPLGRAAGACRDRAADAGGRRGATVTTSCTSRAHGPVVSIRRRNEEIQIIASCRADRCAWRVSCREVAACQRCGELASTRTQTVFGVGNPLARLVFLGEAPGADEDRQGEPFVGRAGQLLNKIIEACTLRREDVYILNILKCRPPGNRNPAPAEAANCRDFLERQLAIIQPEFICCLGAVAAQNLLDTTVAIGQLRGRFHRFGDAQVMATYHPAYLLRNPAAKHATWDDMRMLMQAMGIAVPER